MKLLTIGKTDKEIANEINLSERTVKAIFNKMKEKAEVQTLDELLKYAKEMDLT